MIFMMIIIQIQYQNYFLKNFCGKNNKAVFLDRDGVLIEDVHHIDSENKVHLCDNVVPFLKKQNLVIMILL